MTLTTGILGSSLRAHFWMGGYFRSEYYTLFGEEFLLVFASGDETCSSMVIQVHQDIGDTGYIQIQVTQYTYIITRLYIPESSLHEPPVTYPAQWYVSTVQYNSLHKM